MVSFGSFLLGGKVLIGNWFPAKKQIHQKNRFLRFLNRNHDAEVEVSINVQSPYSSPFFGKAASSSQLTYLAMQRGPMMEMPPSTQRGRGFSLNQASGPVPESAHSLLFPPPLIQMSTVTLLPSFLTQ